MYFLIIISYFLPQKGWSSKNFPDQSEALGGAIAPIASSLWLSEAPKALRESHRSLPSRKPCRSFKAAGFPARGNNYKKCIDCHVSFLNAEFAILSNFFFRFLLFYANFFHDSLPPGLLPLPTTPVSPRIPQYRFRLEI